MKKLILIFTLIALLGMPTWGWATTYYVDNTLPGTCTGTSYSIANRNCTGSDGHAWNNIGSANTVMVGGDITYIRAGTYTFSGSNLQAIAPTHNGTCTPPNFTNCRITYMAYPGEYPLLQSTGGTGSSGIFLDSGGNRYIRVSGLTFLNFRYGLYARNYARYNEIDHNTFYNDSNFIDTPMVTVYIFGSCGNGTYTCSSTHNWVHDNILHDLAATNGCSEGGDGITIGSASAGDSGSNNNTIENNLIYHLGHTLTDSFTANNVWRGNIGHNEGWRVDPTSTVTISIASPAIVTTSGTNYLHSGDIVDFTTTGTLPTGISPASSWARYCVVRINASTFSLKNSSCSTAINTSGSQSGVHTVRCQMCADPANNPGAGKYGHRNFHIDSLAAQRSVAGTEYNLFENNRSGYASANPNNNGADGLSLSSGHNIVRYNAFFGADGPGIDFKNGVLSQYNHVYNNTIYSNGQYSGDCTMANYSTCANSPLNPAGMYFWNSSAINNSIKNNIIYNNTDKFDAYQANYDNNTWAGNLCDSTQSGCASCCTTIGDPKFTDTTMTDMTSTTKPDLTLLAGSPAINAGAVFTTVSAVADQTHITLTDALYFQDGSWGSDLVRANGTFTPDVIAIGTVGNTASIAVSGINYANNTVTLASAPASTIHIGDNVWLYAKSDGTRVLYGSAPDLGAYPYQGAGTYYVLAISSSHSSFVPSAISGITSGNTTTLELYCDNGWDCSTISGTCGGSFGSWTTTTVGKHATFTTSAIVADCSVTSTPTAISVLPASH